MDVYLAKIHKEVQYSSQVSLFVPSCGLIVERKYICYTFLVELYTSHQMHITVVYSYLSVTFCDGFFSCENN